MIMKTIKSGTSITSIYAEKKARNSGSHDLQSVTIEMDDFSYFHLINAIQFAAERYDVFEDVKYAVELYQALNVPMIKYDDDED